MKRIRLVISMMIAALFAAALMGSLVGCASDDGEIGNIIDRTLWDMRGYPSQQEILDHLRDKYGEEFGLITLNSGARFFQGTAYSLNNPDLVFNLELHDDDGNPVAIEYMRDDFQARLVEQLIDEQVRHIVESYFGKSEIADFRVDVAIFDRIDTGTLPVNLEWVLDDGLVALADNEDVSVQMTFRIAFENEATLLALSVVDVEGFAEQILYDGEIPFSASMVLRAADSGSGDTRDFSWVVEDGTIVEFNDRVLW